MNHELEPTLLIESDRCLGNNHEQPDRLYYDHQIETDCESEINPSLNSQDTTFEQDNATDRDTPVSPMRLFVLLIWHMAIGILLMIVQFGLRLIGTYLVKIPRQAQPITRLKALRSVIKGTQTQNLHH